MKTNRFYVYFDTNNRIVGISPGEDDYLNSSYRHKIASYKEVEPYLTGQKRQSDAIVALAKGSVTKYFITDRTSKIGKLYDIQSELVRIKPIVNKNYDVKIKVNNNKKTIEINLSANAKKDIKETLKQYTNNIHFHYTLKDDPDSYLWGFCIHMRDLLKGKVTLDIHSHSSITDQYNLFTTKIFDNYSYIVTGNTK